MITRAEIMLLVRSAEQWARNIAYKFELSTIAEIEKRIIERASEGLAPCVALNFSIPKEVLAVPGLADEVLRWIADEMYPLGAHCSIACGMLLVDVSWEEKP
jgi:hypothetical protein